MKAFIAAGLVAGLVAASPAAAQTVVDGPNTLEPRLFEAVAKLVTRDFEKPGDARFRKLKKSLARNGHGYCGEVRRGEAADFVPFHAIVEEGGQTSLLLLSDHAGTPADKELAERLLRNFGCTE